MAWTKFQYMLCVMMVSTGTVNTVAAKLIDRREARCRDDKRRHFDHPYLQSSFMFLGELFLLIVYKLTYYVFTKKGKDVESSVVTRGNRNFSVWILLVPAWCDMIGTTLMLIGLVKTYASSFQMLRGSIIIFTGLLSMIFLKAVLKKKAWLGILCVIIGLGIIGLADYLVAEKSTSGHSVGDIIIGDCLIISGQFSAAIQMVYEEKFVKGLDINACQAIGWEGVFGLVSISLLQIPFYWIPAGGFTKNSREVVEDVPEAFIQMGDDNIIILLMAFYALSICFFNFAGISITKELSATTRTVLDSIRTFFVYLFSLFLFKQEFHWLQILGFASMLMGMCLYNNVSVKWLSQRFRKNKDGTPDGEGNQSNPSKQLSNVE